MKIGNLAQRADIQGLRALAVLLVVAFHAGLPVSGGFIGVDVFFVISGFVITAMLLREWQRDERINLGQFYLRRFKRLAPALAVVVLVTLGLSALLLPNAGDVQSNAAQTAVGAVLMYANFAIASSTGGYFDAPAEMNPLLNMWSLSVEEQFYIVFPALLIVGLIAARKFKWPSAVTLAVSLAGLASFGVMLFGDPDNMFFGFYSPLPRAWEFVVGVLLAIAVHTFQNKPINDRTGQALAISGYLGVSAILASAFFLNGEAGFPSLWTLVPVLGAGMLLISGLNTESHLTRLLSTKPIVKVGDWSYSVYLWHWPLIVFANILWPGNWVPVITAALLAIPLGAISYRWVEQPMRKVNIKRVGILLIAAVYVTGPTQAANAVVEESSNGWGQVAIQDFRNDIKPNHEGYNLGCYKDRVGYALTWNEACTFNASAEGTPIYLVGDSNSDHFSEGMIAAGEQMGSPVFLRSMSRCPIGDMSIHFRGELDTECLQFNELILSWLSTQERGIVVLGFTGLYVTGADYALESPAGGVVRDTDGRTGIFADAIASSVKRINAMGHTVILVEPVTSFARPDSNEKLWATMIADCSLLTALSRGECMPAVLDNGTIDKAQGAVWKAIREAAKRVGVTTIDTQDSLCSPVSGCSTWKSGTWLYRDATHLSVRGSKLLKDTFVESLTKAQALR